jgi:hypothetical protein
MMSKKAFDKIAAGLREALSVVRGEVDPAKIHQIPLTRGSGNIFADLGLDDAEALLLKARRQGK